MNWHILPRLIRPMPPIATRMVDRWISYFDYGPHVDSDSTVYEWGAPTDRTLHGSQTGATAPVPVREQQEAQRAYELRDLDITARLLGDPPPGRSALDHRGARK